MDYKGIYYLVELFPLSKDLIARNRSNKIAAIKLSIPGRI